MKQNLDIIERLMARYMRFRGGKSYSKIAKTLGVYPSTVRRYLKPIERKGGN